MAFFNSLNRFGAFSRHRSIIIVHLPLIREKISRDGQACTKIFGFSVFVSVGIFIVTFRYLVYNSHLLYIISIMAIQIKRGEVQ